MRSAALVVLKSTAVAVLFAGCAAPPSGAPMATATGPMGDAGTVNARKSTAFGSAPGGIGMRVRAGSTSLGGANAAKSRVRILLRAAADDVQRPEPPTAPAATESAR